MATGGATSSPWAGEPLEKEDEFTMCVLCLGPCYPEDETLGCGCWYCYHCIVRLADEQGDVKCASCRTTNDVLHTTIRKLSDRGEIPAATAKRANAICKTAAAPQTVVITHVKPRPPLTEVQRRHTETAEVRVRDRVVDNDPAVRFTFVA